MSTQGWQIVSKITQYLGRYECTEGGSSKFWECLPDGDNPGKYATRWGAIKLTKTKHNTKPNMSAGEAADKIAEKMKKGYRFVQPSTDVMASRFAEEDMNELQRGTKKIKPVIEQAPEARVAPRRL